MLCFEFRISCFYIMSQLKKDLTLYGLTMVAIGSCIGSGIFLTPAKIAGYLSSPALILIVWAIGGIIAISGALTFAELSARFPRAGGIYVFIKEGYSDLFAFLYGWANILVINSGAIAALSLGFATYISFIIPMGDGTRIALAAGSIVMVTAVNIVGVKSGEMFSNVFTGLKLIGIATIILIGLIMGSAELNTYEINTSEMPDSMGTAIGLALIGVIFSYGGFQHASYLAGEAKNPTRNVPLAMIMGAGIVGIVYLLTNLSYLYLLPVNEMIGSDDIAARAIISVIPTGGTLIALIIAISCLGTAGIYTMSSPRIYYAMASDGIFFKKLAELHPKYQTPVYSILMQSAWAIVLLIFWGTFHDLITYILFTDWIFLTMAAVSIFIFRFRKMPCLPVTGGQSLWRRHAGREPSPYKTFAYPVTPIIFIVLSLFLVINTLIERPEQAFAGLGFLVLGVPVYYSFKRFAKKTGTSGNSDLT